MCGFSFTTSLEQKHSKRDWDLDRKTYHWTDQKRRCPRMATTTNLLQCSFFAFQIFHPISRNHIKSIGYPPWGS